MSDQVRAELLENAALLQRVAAEMSGQIMQAGDLIARALQAGGKVAFCGNGGSAADAQHLAGELVGRFRAERPAWAALALTTDTSILTAVGNDYGFEEVFARQVEGLLNPGDVLVALSTSGNAPNCIRAVETARARGVTTVGMTGASGGSLAELCDQCLKVPHDVTAYIQVAHISVGHAICGLVEAALAGVEEGA